VKSYVVEFRVLEPCSSAAALRQWLTKTLPWTRELAVAGDERTLSVHVRTSRPDLALGAGRECGRLRDVLVEPEVAAHGRC
jgi:dihydroxyacetone kinase-like predicted kinase